MHSSESTKVGRRHLEPALTPLVPEGQPAADQVARVRDALRRRGVA